VTLKKVKPPESVSVRLPEELLKRIDERAIEERRSRGNLIRLLLERAMESEGR
jgi:metal-responsive CopG/Arc/MetJ family transcriptional regulator